MTSLSEAAITPIRIAGYPGSKFIHGLVPGRLPFAVDKASPMKSVVYVYMILSLNRMIKIN